MERRITYTFAAAILTALFALLGLSLFAVSSGSGEEVIITGWLHVDDRTVHDVVLVVEVDDDRCLHAELLGNGRFTIAVPSGSKAHLKFLKPGHVTKEVLVDTRHAQPLAEASRNSKKVKFDVVLEPEQRRKGRSYAGPVGSVAFAKGTGAMTVRRHVRMIDPPASATHDPLN